MIRTIIKIDESKCDGCGLCVSACHEGALALVDGKAKLLRDDYCDGLGNCLPACPMEAISFEEREAAAFDEVAVKAQMERTQSDTLACGCPGTHSQTIEREVVRNDAKAQVQRSQLSQWPVQIKLVPPTAPYFQGAKLLVAADCSAYAYGGFHEDYMRGRITLIGCPKLDEGDYAEKLTDILRSNDIKSVTVTRMEVPCCGGIELAVKTALQNCGKLIPWQVVTISTDGRLLED